MTLLEQSWRAVGRLESSIISTFVIGGIRQERKDCSRVAHLIFVIMYGGQATQGWSKNAEALPPPSLVGHDNIAANGLKQGGGELIRTGENITPSWPGIN